MIDKEVIRDRIKHETERMRYAFAFLVLVSGGTIRLALIEPQTGLLVGLRLVGLILSIVLVVILLRQDQTILRHLRELEEEDHDSH